MKALLLSLIVSLSYSQAVIPHGEIQGKTAVIYQRNIIDELDPSRPRIV